MVGVFGDGGRSQMRRRSGLAEALVAMQDKSTKATGIASLFAPSRELPCFSWQGADGNWYPHSVIRGFDINWTCPANYAFVRRNSDGTITPYYFGIAWNISQRMIGHEKLVPAILAGANELHIYLLAKTESERVQVEKTLIARHAPLLNIQHNPDRSGLGSIFG